MTALLLALFCLSPVEAAKTERVDRVMLHYYYDENGALLWTQLVYFDWNAKDSHFDVVAYRIVRQPGQVPYYSHERQAWVAIWFDRDILRRVEAASFTVFHAQYDPEAEETERLPASERRELRK